MNIALVGTGKTGTSVNRLAHAQGHTVVAQFDSSHRLLDASSPEALYGADVIIDFTTPELALAHIERYCSWNACAIIGTTGWYDSLDEVLQWVTNSKAGILYAPNFSIGVAVLSTLLKTASVLFNQLPAYDCYIHELHHRQKKDSPSGTALHLGQLALDRLDHKSHLDIETQHQAIAPDALHVSSTRTGHLFGTHTVGFDSPYDHITFVHESKNRDGFAYGALRAAEWMIGREGLFTLDDLIAEWL